MLVSLSFWIHDGSWLMKYGSDDGLAGPCGPVHLIDELEVDDHGPELGWH